MPKKPPNGLDSEQNPTEEELKDMMNDTEEENNTSDEEKE